MLAAFFYMLLPIWGYIMHLSWRNAGAKVGLQPKQSLKELPAVDHAVVRHYIFLLAPEMPSLWNVILAQTNPPCRITSSVLHITITQMSSSMV